MEVFLLDGYDRAIKEEYLHLDRKSTRLNSSHLVISYAVFCLKKKTKLPQHVLEDAHITPIIPILTCVHPHHRLASDRIGLASRSPATSLSSLVVSFTDDCSAP